MYTNIVNFSSEKQSKTEVPIQKQQSQSSAASRTTRSSTRTTRTLLDNSDSKTLSSKSVLTMSQNELLECILSRLEDLESSQTRTSLRVRVLTQRLMRQKQKHINSQLNDRSVVRKVESAPISIESSNSSDVDAIMSNGDENDANLLASMGSL